MSEPLITAEEFIEKYAHLKIELLDGRVAFSGRPVEIVGDGFRYPGKPLEPVTGCVLRKPPQHCVEVRSPSNTWIEIFAKVGDFLKAGVTSVLVLDADTRTAYIFRADTGMQIFHANDTLTLPDILPGFSVPVGRFFA